MKPPAFDYVEPSDLDEAIALLSADGDARPLAGGQSLVPMLSFRLAFPSALVGLRRLPGLRKIHGDGGELRVGAMVTQREALQDPRVAGRCPLLWEALRCIGHPQIRSRGTLGGSLAHADPAAELPAVLVALEGGVTARGPAGPRSIPADDLFLGHYTTALAPGELLTDVHVPLAPRRTGAACVELTRRPGDFALVGAACQLSLDGEGAIEDPRVVLFGIGEAPVRARTAERVLRGARPGERRWEAAEQVLREDLEDLDLATGDREYRSRVAPAVVTRGLRLAARRAEARDV